MVRRVPSFFWGKMIKYCLLFVIFKYQLKYKE